MIDLSYEQLLSDDEILSSLAITQEDLNKLEDRGLQFIKIEDSHFFLSSTLLAFLKGIEGKAEKRGWPKKSKNEAIGFEEETKSETGSSLSINSESSQDCKSPSGNHY